MQPKVWSSERFDRKFDRAFTCPCQEGLVLRGSSLHPAKGLVPKPQSLRSVRLYGWQVRDLGSVFRRGSLGFRLGGSGFRVYSEPATVPASYECLGLHQLAHLRSVAFTSSPAPWALRAASSTSAPHSPRTSSTRLHILCPSPRTDNYGR